MYPYEPEDPDEAVMECEGWCLEEGLRILFDATGFFEPDEDGFVFIPDRKNGEGICPWCGSDETVQTTHMEIDRMIRLAPKNVQMVAERMRW